MVLRVLVDEDVEGIAVFGLEKEGLGAYGEDDPRQLRSLSTAAHFQELDRGGLEVQAEIAPLDPDDVTGLEIGDRAEVLVLRVLVDEDVESVGVLGLETEGLGADGDDDPHQLHLEAAQHCGGADGAGHGPRGAGGSGRMARECEVQGRCWWGAGVRWERSLPPGGLLDDEVGRADGENAVGSRSATHHDDLVAGSGGGWVIGKEQPVPQRQLHPCTVFQDDGKRKVGGCHRAVDDHGLALVRRQGGGHSGDCQGNHRDQHDRQGFPVRIHAFVHFRWSP